MTRPDDVTPERLAELADGSPPRDAAERELMALMADVRDLDEPAPDALRTRVRAIAAGEAEPGRAHWWQVGRQRLLAFGAPVAAAIVVLAIAIPVMTSDSGEPAPAAATAEALADDSAAPAAPAAPEAASGAAAADAPDAARAVAPSAPPAPAPAPAVGNRLRLEVNDAAALAAAVRQARAEVANLGGTLVVRGDQGTRRLIVRVPGDRAGEALAALGRLGRPVAEEREAAPPSAGDVTIRVTITAGG